ncbi:methionyl aminopeptidase [Dendrothele bispora CBS 962.96]|uniref:Methionine aminopeptidase n=1 Tax=Dendrothele bispora (strain CBS 962.96) TaxID=1314807 RepID=A0A4S8L9P5_DENBC|nr:methionyl aminopeptidase [Dendrothele bispora CBS 962.96]
MFSLPRNLPRFSCQNVLFHRCNLRHFSSTRRASSSSESDHDAQFGVYSVILPQEPFVFGVTHIQPRQVPPSIPRPPYALQGPKRHALSKPKSRFCTSDDGKIRLGTEEEEKMRRAATLARDVREFCGGLVKVGVTTDSIDAAVHEYIVSHGAYPSPLLYQNYPKSCCTSINNVIVHGIPDDRPLEDGDIVNIDITVYLDGYHGDTSRTWLVGDVDVHGRTLVSLTNAALKAGIAACGPGKPFRGIGKAIHELVNNKKISSLAASEELDLTGMEFCVSPEFNGHGIGKEFHRQPWILHHLNDEPGIMEPGHCFTIEPAVIQGSDPHGWIFPDGWTASTENCTRSAQAEHTVLITETGVDVLTS